MSVIFSLHDCLLVFLVGCVVRDPLVCCHTCCLCQAIAVSLLMVLRLLSLLGNLLFFDRLRVMFSDVPLNNVFEDFV